MWLFDFIAGIWQGPETCLTGGCKHPTAGDSNHCKYCHDEMEQLVEGEPNEREREYVRRNIGEWKRLMAKHRDIK